MVTAKWSTNPGARFLYAGNVVDGDIDILRRDDDALTKISSLALPGYLAPMRGSSHEPDVHPPYEPGSSAVGSMWRSESRNACTSRAASTLPA